MRYYGIPTTANPGLVARWLRRLREHPQHADDVSDVHKVHLIVETYGAHNAKKPWISKLAEHREELPASRPQMNSSHCDRHALGAMKASYRQICRSRVGAEGLQKPSKRDFILHLLAARCAMNRGNIAPAWEIYET
jgi:hypothetical protein